MDDLFVGSGDVPSLDGARDPERLIELRGGSTGRNSGWTSALVVTSGCDGVTSGF